jgi:GT2 family glycosyltransferase
LCWRAFNLGYHTKFTYKSTVYHVGGATLQQSNPKKTFLNFRNSLLMLVKNLPKNQLFPILFMRLCLDGLAGIQFLVKGKFSHFFAILKHILLFIVLAINFIKKELPINAPITIK